MKKHFQGRELYYYIRAVHRQFNYRPFSQVFGSADLFVQVIVFATVYLFLSNLTSLQGTAFLSLRDLGSADGLLFGANLLPLLMTAINAATVYLYVRNRTRRLQAWCLAILFLVLLYDSPSGLVLYWTINNLVSFTRAYLQGKLAWNPPDDWQDNLAILRRQE